MTQVVEGYLGPVYNRRRPRISDLQMGQRRDEPSDKLSAHSQQTDTCLHGMNPTLAERDKHMQQAAFVDSGLSGVFMLVKSV